MLYLLLHIPLEFPIGLIYFLEETSLMPHFLLIPKINDFVTLLSLISRDKLHLSIIFLLLVTNVEKVCPLHQK